MSQLFILNATPWNAYVRLNSLGNIPNSPIDASQEKFGYYPFSTQVPRDLSQQHPSTPVWGAINDLTIRWEETSGADTYVNLEDPTGNGTQDLLLWIMVGEIQFSVGNSWVSMAKPS